MTQSMRLGVTSQLKQYLSEIGESEGWTAFDKNDFPGGRAYAWNIAHGRQKTVPHEIYKATGLKPATVIFEINKDNIDPEIWQSIMEGQIKVKVKVLNGDHTQITCDCNAYPFPHRQGGGKCCR